VSGDEAEPISRRTSARAYVGAAAIVLACTLVCRAMLGRFDHSNLIMVYLLGVAFVAVRGGRGPAALAACLSVAAFDFFLVPPHLTFAVADTQYLVTFAVMLAVGLLISTLAVRAREQAEVAARARLAAESERLRNTLLSSVSHDLRTPLAAIAGAASTLLHDHGLDEDTRRDLLETVAEESHRLDQRVTNLLEMTRLESGALTLHHEWHPLEEVIGSALARLEPRLAGWRVETSLAPALPLVPMEAVLVEQVLVNLLENAVQYASPARSIRLAARVTDGALVVEVADEGPGLAAGTEERIFEKFYRGPSRRRGFGLGLAICRAIVAAHGGRIWAANRPPRGSVFRFTLPIGAAAPPAAPEDDAAQHDGP
jgi:two-component system sensor histidine kinase KdpD